VKVEILELQSYVKPRTFIAHGPLLEKILRCENSSEGGLPFGIKDLKRVYDISKSRSEDIIIEPQPRLGKSSQ
jgi:hypothetical protein